VIKKEAGLPNAREATRTQGNALTSTQTPGQVSLKKELAEGQLYQMQEKPSDHKGRPR